MLSFFYFSPGPSGQKSLMWHPDSFNIVLRCVFVPKLWSADVSFAIVELTAHEDFCYLIVTHSDDMTNPLQLRSHSITYFAKRSSFEILSSYCVYLQTFLMENIQIYKDKSKSKGDFHTTPLFPLMKYKMYSDALLVSFNKLLHPL